MVQTQVERAMVPEIKVYEDKKAEVGSEVSQESNSL